MTKGASRPRAAHRSRAGAALAAAVAMLGGLAAGCSDPDRASSGGSVDTGGDATHWALDPPADLETLDRSISGIIGAVEGNDVRLLRDSPEECAASAGSLAERAGSAGDEPAGARLAELASLCEWLTGPTEAGDTDGVMLTLDPLFSAISSITPLLDLLDEAR